jgi:hypothetical protein
LTALNLLPSIGPITDMGLVARSPHCLSKMASPASYRLNAKTLIVLVPSVETLGARQVLIDLTRSRGLRCDF